MRHEERSSTLMLAAMAVVLGLTAIGLVGSSPAGAGLPASGPQLVFAARSYQPGQWARLRLLGTVPQGSTVQLFRAGARDAYGADHSLGVDRLVYGAAVDQPQPLAAGPATPSGVRVVRLYLGQWPSGVYFARLTEPSGTERYAPFVLRPGAPHERVLVVVPTNTWQAYNKQDEDSWYLSRAVTETDLERPYPGLGLPPHYLGYDLGFERWYATTGARADWSSDEDLEHLSGAWLRSHYDLIVFPGHEEYVTPHTRQAVVDCRDRGGSLAFLSSNDFFYRVDYRYQPAIAGHTGTLAGGPVVKLMHGRRRWRDLGYPEERLVGIHYVGWSKDTPLRPYRVVSLAGAPWLFADSGLRAGSTFGSYGIEVDQTSPLSPAGVKVLAAIPDALGPGHSAEMTYYHLGHAQVFAAGVTNFGGTAGWPVVRVLMANLWTHLSGQALELPVARR